MTKTEIWTGDLMVICIAAPRYVVLGCTRAITKKLRPRPEALCRLGPRGKPNVMKTGWHYSASPRRRHCP